MEFEQPSSKQDDRSNPIAPVIWGVGVLVMAGFVGWQLVRSSARSVSTHRSAQVNQTTGAVGVLPSVSMTPELVRGRSFFEMSCALCHGDRGDGNGRFSMGQVPRPRDFRRAKFKFATTTNLVPSDDDLVRLFRVGVPGATMPGYPQADRGELLAVAAYVRKLSADGVSADLSREIASGSLSLDEAKRILVARTTPGAAVVVPPEPGVDELRLANGKRVYLEACVKCHGADGTPDTSVTLFDEDGTRNIPRRFAQGYFKGGEEGALLFVRVLNGMPGTPMPSFKEACSPADIWDVVHYLQRLSRRTPQQ